MEKLSEEDKKEVRKLFEEWEDANLSLEQAEVDEQRTRDALDSYEIDPDRPPAWLKKLTQNLCL